MDRRDSKFDKEKKVGPSLDSTQRYLVRMQSLCSTREMCAADVKKRLERAELEKAEINDIIGKLIEDGFVDDSRYAGAFVRDKAKFSGWGPRKIEFELRKKQIDSAIIGKALSTIDTDTRVEKLERLLEQKLKSIKLEEERDKVMAKLMRFAVGRGFGYEDVSKSLKKILEKRVNK